MNTIQIRAVIFREAAFYCAQCLERDIAVQASSLDELLRELSSTLSAYAELALKEGRVPFADLPPAPDRFHEMFKLGHSLVVPPRVIAMDDAPNIVPEIRVMEPVAA